MHLSQLEFGGVSTDSTHPFASGGLTNSWPRFSPFVQTYQGKKLYWDPKTEQIVDQPVYVSDGRISGRIVGKAPSLS